MSTFLPLIVLALFALAVVGQQTKKGPRRGRAAPRRPEGRGPRDAGTAFAPGDVPVPVPAPGPPGVDPSLPSPEEENGPWPFYAKRPLTPREQEFYFRLLKALPEFVVLSQVGLSRFLGVRSGHNFGRWFNRINRMTADYVVCTRDLSIVAVIELDDATHQRPDRQAADAKKDKAIAAAGLRMVRWQARSFPDEAQIRATLIDPRHRPTPTAAEAVDAS